MKAVSILAITNAVALGAALLLFLEVEDLKGQVGTSRSDSRGGTEVSIDIEDFEALRGRVDRHDEQFAIKGARSGAPIAKAADDATAADATGEAIDRGYASGKFDEEVARADPAMDGFRNRVRLAEKMNQREDRVNREVERIEKLISDSKIATLNPKQMTQVADKLIEYRDSRGMMFRGMWQRPEIQNAAEGERREVFRDLMKTESETLSATAQKDLEKIMPAADAKTLLDASRGGDRGASRMRRGR